MPFAGGPRKEPAGGATDPGRRTVWILRSGKPQRVTIHCGVTDGSMSEVLEGGLSQGDLVITDMSSGGSGGQQPAFRLRMF